jgi:AraC family transcriptional regulator
MISRYSQDNAQIRRKAEYIARINRTIDYIERHLDRELTLEELARTANFSKYHFHRIFQAMVGETLGRFIRRVRLEKAANRLIQNPRTSVIEIALDCGFSGSASFAKAFKELFGMSAGQWRAAKTNNRKLGKPNGNLGKHLGKAGKDTTAATFYIERHTPTQIWRINMEAAGMEKIEVKEMPELHVAYVRHTGPYKKNAALFEALFGQICTWAGPRDLLGRPEARMLAVYHDDPNITEEEKLRVSVGVSVPEGTAVDGEVGAMTLPGGRFAVGRFVIAGDGFEAAWKQIMGEWLPQSGYQPDDRLCYELYPEDPKKHPEGKFTVDICVPVKPL